MTEIVLCTYCAKKIYINVESIDGYHKKCKRLHDEQILSLCEPQTRDLLKRIKIKIQLHGLYEQDSEFTINLNFLSSQKIIYNCWLTGANKPHLEEWVK